MMTMGTDERQERCADEGYIPERTLSTDAFKRNCKSESMRVFVSQVNFKSIEAIKNG